MLKINEVLGFQPTLYLDDGHGLEPEPTAGKRTPPISELGNLVIYENEFNRAVVKKIKPFAEQIGFRVVQTASEDTDVSLWTRVNRVNKDFSIQRTNNPGVPWNEVGVGVSVHYNALNGVFDEKKGGVEVFHHATSTYGKELAQLVLDNLLQGYPQVSRGVKDNTLYITKNTTPVFILAECGFMDNVEEAKLMIDDDFQTECAKEILRGVCQYYGQDIQITHKVQYTTTQIEALINELEEKTQEIVALRNKLKQIHELSN